MNTKGGFEFTDGILICKNARFEVLSKKNGDFELNSGTISGNFNSISNESKGGNIEVDPLVGGYAVLENYCLNGGSLINNGSLSILPGANDCNKTSTYFLTCLI